MACPFFLPVEKLENATWLHAHRLPLGAGWAGRCTAAPQENACPSAEELRDFCNLGYASQCARLPADRAWDSVRFGAKISSGREVERSGACVQLRYICERNHRPAAHGQIEFQLPAGPWKQKHHDLRIQRMAECFLVTWLEKKQLRNAVAAAAS